jgi:replication factor C subunit 1
VRGDVLHTEYSDHYLREKLNIPANVLEQLIQGAQSDIRQVLNMLSTWKLSRGDMSFDESKSL